MLWPPHDWIDNSFPDHRGRSSSRRSAHGQPHATIPRSGLSFPIPTSAGGSCCPFKPLRPATLPDTERLSAHTLMASWLEWRCGSRLASFRLALYERLG